MGIDLEIVHPADWMKPKGYANGIVAPAGSRLLFVAGQIAWDEQQKFVSDDFAAQYDQALANVLTVVTAAGGAPEMLARMVVYVTDKQEYIAATKAIGLAWRARLGKHYPTMALVEVKGLLEDRAKVEIEGIAVLPAV
jgi:enamine deaminase RidA (YjgF/YER057c/UK114 family)